MNTQTSMKVADLIKVFEDKRISSFENSKRQNIPSSKKVSSLICKFEVKTLSSVEASPKKSVCDIADLEDSCSAFKYNLDSSSSVDSVHTAPTFESDDTSTIDDSSLNNDTELPIPSCINVENCVELDSKMGDLIKKEMEYDEFRIFLACLEINY